MEYLSLLVVTFGSKSWILIFQLGRLDLRQGGSTALVGRAGSHGVDAPSNTAALAPRIADVSRPVGLQFFGEFDCVFSCHECYCPRVVEECEQCEYAVLRSSGTKSTNVIAAL